MKININDIKKQVTEKVISYLEGVDSGSWEMPWVKLGSSMPINVKSGKNYNGVNILILWIERDQMGFSSDVWGTYKQWSEKGAQVKKGSVSTKIFFYKTIEKINKETGEKEKFFLPRVYSVFNADQVEGYEVEKIESPVVSDDNKIESVEALIDTLNPRIEYSGDQPCYIPVLDKIMMTPINQFKGSSTSDPVACYYSTLFHEIGHWTGHESRLNRELNNRFGSKAYAMEEMVVEMSSAFNCVLHGVTPVPREDHAKYIKGWISVLKDDVNALMSAASAASKIVDFVNS